MKFLKISNEEKIIKIARKNTYYMQKNKGKND